MAYRAYSDDYVDAEAAARAAGAGMWAGAFQNPAVYRGDQRTGAASRPANQNTAPPDPACPIKGNISRNGNRRYHVPGGRDYAQTRIDTGYGERWFCAEAEAEYAGWRTARR